MLDLAANASPKGGSAMQCSDMLKHFAHRGFTRAFQVEYRLSQGPPLTPEGAFPAALIDAVAGYHYLVDTLGFDPQNILVTGESAGGNLAIALVRYLIAHVPSLPPPGAVFLMSPTVDWGSSHAGAGSSLALNAVSDMAYSFFDGYPPRALLGNLPASDADTNAWISPASLALDPALHLFASFPPTLIISGGAEMGVDAMRTLHKRMGEDIGDSVKYVEFPDATHTFMSFTWHEPERTQGYEEVASWYKSLSIV